MARKKIESALSLTETHMDEITKAVVDMLGVHNQELTTLIEEGEDRCVTVNFAVELDCSESAPTIDDPKQPNLFTMLTPSELKKRDAEIAKKAKAAKDEDDE